MQHPQLTTWVEEPAISQCVSNHDGDLVSDFVLIRIGGNSWCVCPFFILFQYDVTPKTVSSVVK